MARKALVLAMVASAFGFLLPTAAEMHHLPLSLPVLFALFMPATLLGARVWCGSESFARSLPVLACVLLAWIGLTYARETESHRGVLIAGYLTIVLPIGALIVQQRAWQLCAKTYVWANMVAFAFTAWLQLLDRGMALSSLLLRFGLIRSYDESRYLTNPNQVGCQFGLAAVIAFVLFLAQARRGRSGAANSGRPGGSLLCWVVLSLATVLTASRGAFAGWFAAMAILLFWGTRRLATAQVRDLIAMGAVGLGLALLVAEAYDVAPWGSLYDRLVGDDSESIGTMAGRTEIWRNAFDVWRSDSAYFVRGVGTGVADEMVAIGDDYADLDQYGQTYRNCHSSVVEWGLSLGLIGLVALAYLMLACLLRARWLDRRDGSVNRQAILLALLAFALTGTVHRRPDWVAAASLVLAMLSDPPRRAAASRRASREPASVTIPPGDQRIQSETVRRVA